jgi:hypothetical protein
MRTTITLQDDVAASLKRLGKRRGIKFKAMVNEALREGIKRMMAPAKKRGEYHTVRSNLACGPANVDNVAEVLAVAESESFK